MTAEQIQKAQFATQEVSGKHGPLANISWNERGPKNVAGRTRALLYDVDDSKIVYAGSVGGGLWRCNNITAPQTQWTKVNDLFDNLAITCIVQDPSIPDIMYFGTGEGWYPDQGVFGIRGMEIWKSQDRALPGNICLLQVIRREKFACWMY